jgi:hypothetical protein
MEAIFHFLLMIVFLIMYVLAFIIVKPLLLNRKHLISTLSLKVSYLVYLGALLISVYLFMFYGPNDIEHQLSEVFFFTILVCLFIPNLGILLRRNFRKYRKNYNYIFSFINLIITFFIIYKLNQFDWFIF